MARPITAFRSPCMTLCASSSPNRPARPARTQKPPRASWDMIVARAPIHVLPFAYGIPHVLPPKPSSQISPHTKRAAHILPSERAAHCHGQTRSARGAQQPLLRFITRYRAPYGRARIPPAARVLPSKTIRPDHPNATAATFRPSARFPHKTQKPPRSPCFLGTARRLVILITPLPAFQWRGRIS